MNPKPLALSITLSIFCALFVLRFLLHSVLAVRIGWSGVTDLDLLIPGGCSLAFFLFILFESQAPPSLHGRRHSVLWIALSFSMSLLLGVLFRASLPHAFWPRAGFFVSVLILLCSIVCYWIPFHYFRLHPNKWLAVPFVLSGLSVAFLQVIPDPLWGALVSEMGESVCPWLQPFLIDGYCRVTNTSVASASGYAIRLTHSFFAFDIGKGCSGLDGLSVFNSFFIILVGFYRKYFTALTLTLAASAGMLWFVFLNGLRILLIVNGTALINRYFGADAAVKWGFGLFHSHIGWVVYLVGGLGYIALVRSFLVNPIRSLATNHPSPGIY